MIIFLIALELNTLGNPNSENQSLLPAFCFKLNMKSGLNKL